MNTKEQLKDPRLLRALLNFAGAPILKGHTIHGSGDLRTLPEIKVKSDIQLINRLLILLYLE